MGKPKCTCLHLGHCPLMRGGKAEDMLLRTDLDDNPLWKPFEGLGADDGIIMSAPGQPDLPRGSALGKLCVGALVGTDGRGTVIALAQAVDPDRTIAYGRSKVGTRCKANSFIWRKRHPVPKPKEEPDHDDA